MKNGPRITIPLPRRPSFLVGILITLSIVGGFMALDKTVLHVYTEESGAERGGAVDLATGVSRYTPPVVGSVEGDGNCFASSLTSGRSDALRCGVDNMIYDPCFSGPSDVVVCPRDPREDSDDVAFHNRPQFRFIPGQRPGAINPWFIVLETGDACRRESNPGQLARTSFGETVYSCSSGGLACSEATSGSPFWTVGCFDSAVSGPLKTLRVLQVWE